MVPSPIGDIAGDLRNRGSVQSIEQPEDFLCDSACNNVFDERNLMAAIHSVTDLEIRLAAQRKRAGGIAKLFEFEFKVKIGKLSLEMSSRARE
jgi:hypothetical protein